MPRRKRNTEAKQPVPSGPRGMFDLPDGHYYAQRDDRTGGGGWGFDKRGDRISPAPCEVEVMDSLISRKQAVDDLMSAVSRYAHQEYARIRGDQNQFWNRISKALAVDVTGGVDLVWLRDGSLRIVEPDLPKAKEEKGA